jgi:hypothetical protein
MPRMPFARPSSPPFAKPRTSSRYFQTIVATALLLLLAISVAYGLRSRAVRNDFAHYYVSSRAWLDGRNPYTVSFSEEFAKFGFVYEPKIPRASNPPPLIIAFSLFALFPVTTAFYGWVLVQIISLGMTVFLIYRLVSERCSRDVFAFLTIALVISGATIHHFRYSQVQLQLGALLLLAYVQQQRGSYSRSWLLATVAASLKLFPVVMIPWFVWSAAGHWTAKVRWLVPTALFILGMTAASWSLWPGFLSTGLDVVRGNVVDRINYSLPALIVNARSALHDSVVAESSAEWIWRLAVILTSSIVILTYAGCHWFRCHDEASFCIILLVTIVSSATVWSHYFVLAFFPFSVFVCAALRDVTTLRLLLVAAVYIGVLHFEPIIIQLHRHLPATFLPLYATFALILWFLKTDGGTRPETGRRAQAPRRGSAEVR